MVFASVTPASYTARAKWFEPVSWSRMSRVCPVCPMKPPPENLSDEKSPAGLEAVGNKEVFEELGGLALAQADDQSRVWGVNSFVRLPAFDGDASRAVAG